ncbi:DUF2807 domain-containing protein [Pontibacter sp. E15-1]|uniref:head GIN domain-containing protein n=1 Tax=Pontibacter sp. E15-1 TaxID=2919918 RepID=UPI001F501574|nr:head GIN domain-containing protein [Pontibacter sp. E15-1]MCJ8163744.1 DUF2807 domain-containing protein [Pontibacter sp. E15-1]
MKIIQFYLATACALVLALLLVDAPLMAQQLRGNGNIQAQDRKVSGFKGIEVSGGFTVEITQGNQERLRIEAEENLLQNIKTEVRNGVLHIYNDKGISTNKGMKAYITIRELNSIHLSGGVKVIGMSAFKMNDLELDLSGASKVTMELHAKELKADMSGASKVEFTGDADKVDMNLSGASKAELAALEARHVRVDASGASKVKVYAKELLDIDASGASAVFYKGKPRITAETSAAARVSKI